ncbi:nurim-like [Asterias amurensis]|uniref:nurim-like n=1 Tax=Asterias amurensis TaxID=7602 RepID=UPI003AB464F8
MAGVSLFKSFFFVIISVLGFAVCFQTVFQFAVFLFRNGFSSKVIGSQQQHEQQQSQRESNEDAANPYLSHLLLDILLIVAFILQHTLMACRLWKDFIQWLGLEVVERSLYILATCAALQLLMFNWRPLFPETILWSLDADSRVVQIIFSFVYFVAWLFVIGVVLVLDYAELVGVKQVYYYLMDLEPPLQLKSREYQRLFSNFRHPILTGLMIVLWVVPVMTIGRLVLALSLTLYTFYGHRLDMQDYDYIRLQHQLKKVMLGSPQGHAHLRSTTVSYG